MTRIEKIYHQGKELIYIDLRNISQEEQFALMKEAEEFILKENKSVLVLSNLTGIHATPEFMKHGNEYGANIKHLLKKQAMVGLTSVQKILLNTWNAITGGKGTAFETEEEAKEWLVKD